MKERTAETDRIIKNLSINFGYLGNRLAEFVEKLVQAGLVRLFRQHGLTVRRTAQILTCFVDAGQFLAQVDFSALDGDTAIAAECQSC